MAEADTITLYISVTAIRGDVASVPLFIGTRDFPRSYNLRRYHEIRNIRSSTLALRGRGAGSTRN